MGPVALLCQAEAWAWVSQQSNCACHCVADFSHLFLQERAGPGLSPQPLLHTLIFLRLPASAGVLPAEVARPLLQEGLLHCKDHRGAGTGGRGVESLKGARCGETRRQVRL